MDTIIYAASWLLIHAAIPFWFIFAPVFSKRHPIIPRRKIGKGIFLSTIIMWPLMFGHRIAIEVPYVMKRTEDPMYDGVAGSSGILMLGWLMALFLQLPHIILRLLVDRIMDNKSAPPSQAEADDTEGDGRAKGHDDRGD